VSGSAGARGRGSKGDGAIRQGWGHACGGFGRVLAIKGPWGYKDAWRVPVKRDRIQGKAPRLARHASSYFPKAGGTWASQPTPCFRTLGSATTRCLVCQLPARLAKHGRGSTGCSAHMRSDASNQMFVMSRVALKSRSGKRHTLDRERARAIRPRPTTRRGVFDAAQRTAPGPLTWRPWP